MTLSFALLAEAERIISSDDQIEISSITIGIHMTAVVLNNGKIGLANTRHPSHSHGVVDVETPGELTKIPPTDIISWLKSETSTPVMKSVASALLDALISAPYSNPDCIVRRENAFALVEPICRGKTVICGPFKFVDKLKDISKKLHVIGAGENKDMSVIDLIESEGENEIDVVLLPGTIFHEGEEMLDNVLKVIKKRIPTAYVGVLGAGLPLTPLVFEYGLNIVAGNMVDVSGNGGISAHSDNILLQIVEGVQFRQLKGLDRVCITPK